MRQRVTLCTFLVLMLVFSAGALADELEKKVLDESMFDEIGEHGGTYTLHLGASPESFNVYGIIDAATYTITDQFLDALI